MEVTEFAPCKVNLGLDTIEKRRDGYHELAMVMTSLDLKDRLVLTETSEDKILVSSNKPYLPSDHKNHAYQVAFAIRKKYGIEKGLHISIEKKIPVAAGLGGGSSDAAAVIRGLNRLWDLHMSLDEMIEIGLIAGTDVPYCLVGKTALVEGLGEKITLLPPLPHMYFILVKPEISVSTPKIFQGLKVKSVSHPPISSLMDGIEEKSYEKIVHHLGNSLEEVTMEKYPVVAEIKKKMIQFGCDGAVMTGSGPTVVGICKKEPQARRIYNSFRGFCQEVYLVRNL